MPKPKPFSRPSVNLGFSSVKRDWKIVPVATIEVGDLVPDYGKVTEVFKNSEEITFHFIEGTFLTLPYQVRLNAFTAVA